MTRYYVEVHYGVHVADRGGLDRHADDILDVLGDVAGLVDPDIGMNYMKRTVTISAMVDAATEGDALNTALTGVRSAIHRIGDSTPGWEWSEERLSGYVRLPDMVDA